MTFLIYLFKTVLISGVLLTYYWLFVRNRFFHGFNRFFLLFIPLACFSLPACHFTLPAMFHSRYSDSPIRLLAVGTGTLEEAFTIYASHRTNFWFTWPALLICVSSIISAILFIRLFRSIYGLLRLRAKQPDMTLPEAKVFIVDVKGTPFSFFHSIYWSEKIDMHSSEGKQILKHEIYHVKNFHSLDMLAIELVSILCWFNPFIYFIRKELQAIHEYAADAYASRGDKYNYAQLLLLNASETFNPVVHPFFKNQIKRRITMITKNSKSKKALLGRFMILPLIAALICLFSFRFQDHFFSHPVKLLRVVIDAGHGGNFTGALSNGQMEKDLNLKIAKKIQALSKEYNVDVIMSRESDVTPGAEDLRQSLEYIAALPGKNNADLFISIHVNATDNAKHGKQQTEKTGFQIYIPPNPNEMYINSVKFGSLMTNVIKADYSIESDLKQPENGNVYVLRNATVPAILIECGYIDNPNDIKYLTDEKNQEKIARDILEGIHQYGLNNSAFEGDLPAMTDSSAPLKKVEVKPSYPGGDAGWGKYLSKTLRYPDSAVDREIQGEVVVEFVVHTDGSISDVKAISGPKLLRAESVRVVAQSGKWIPAMDHGVTVDSYNQQPIRYKLSVQ